jgi:subtilisin family serine protease
VDSADPVDYYSFSLGAENEFSLSLDGLAADANVAVLDLDGNVVTSSSNSGRTAESINTTLDTGAYRIQVTSASNFGTPYNLTVSLDPLIEGITTGGSEVPVFLTTAQSLPLINVDDFRSGNLALGSDPRFAGIDGNGFSTVIIDTGINLNHPYFGADSNGDGVSDRIVHDQDFADDDLDATDVNGHGTNVSSIAAANDTIAGDGGNFTGMAPGANVISLKVFSDSGSGNSGDTEQALQWILGSDNGVSRITRFNIASVNMSLGDSGNYNTPQTLYSLSDELLRLSNLGVIVVSASGNDFFNFGSAQGVAYPSADPNSLSIGAVFDANVGNNFPVNGSVANTTAADGIAPFSQRDQTLTTVFAPGAQITGAGLNDTPGNPGFTSTLSGTSMAAPHVAGMAVLAQQLAVQELDRRLTPTEFRNFLRETGVTINDGDDENDNVTNTGLDFRRVDMLALANRIAPPLQESVTINPIVVNLGQGDRIGEGDSDFDGNGPRVGITTSVRAQGSILTVSVNALFEETESDFTTYSRSFTQDIDLSSQLPTGFVIDRIVSDLENQFIYTDTDHDLNNFDFGPDELVSRYEIQGDSDGGWFGGDDNPFVRVLFNPIRVQNL